MWWCLYICDCKERAYCHESECIYITILNIELNDVIKYSGYPNKQIDDKLGNLGSKNTN